MSPKLFSPIDVKLYTSSSSSSSCPDNKDKPPPPCNNNNSNSEINKSSDSGTDETTEKEDDQKKLTLFQKFKAMYRDYWYVLVPVHCLTSVFWFGGFYFAAERYNLFIYLSFSNFTVFYYCKRINIIIS